MVGRARQRFWTEFEHLVTDVRDTHSQVSKHLYLHYILQQKHHKNNTLVLAQKLFTLYNCSQLSTYVINISGCTSSCFRSLTPETPCRVDKAISVSSHEVQLYSIRAWRTGGRANMVTVYSTYNIVTGLWSIAGIRNWLLREQDRV